MKSNNLPAAQVENLPDDFVRDTVKSLRELWNLGRPTSDSEVQQRIDDYFAFCEKTGCRPGIESLCLSLHISRTTLFNWSRGDGCSKERQETVCAAKSFVNAFLEQASVRGRLNPPVAIFLMKNWMGYKDTYSLEGATETKSNNQTRSIEEIQQEYLGAGAVPEQLPDVDFTVDE